ncbi:oligopeptide ABC transporter permease OppC [Spiroplasma turonicum]|uniref:Oligopeptide ABC transporter permease n=1 Tax=Spiroplasma turonicum TaxID=216946 RepID=A0A0K1P6A2_9MOLU|nr:oligopeptide ABC transporter permease OppC [Spiroplasma turonicum]AKU79800.1 oligopeptide ABC transporter permease [Spiroplasma turonicum]ALX70818.1 oligopeptide ABC transporter permease [Spiroplasma turonicum]
MKYKYYKDNIDYNNIDLSYFQYDEKLSDNQTESIASKPYSYWKSVFKTLVKKKLFMLIVIILIIFIILSLSIARNEVPVPLDRPNKTPATWSNEHWFGLGVMGEDLWNKIWIGTRKTLQFSLTISSIEICLGIIIGLIWGFYSRLDILFIEVIRFLSLIPSLILWLLVIFIFGGKATMPILIGAISITSWIGISSVIRVQTILIRNSEYNIASKVLGSSGFKIMKENILPKILPIVVQTISFSIPSAIALDSTLSYYNFGFINNVIYECSLGSILNDSLMWSSLWKTYPNLLIFPVLFTSGLSFLIFVVGKVISDSLDPKLHR